jgi:hypothetical protein
MQRAHIAYVGALAIASCSHAPKSLASFEGRIAMHTTKPGAESHDLDVTAKGDKLRFDMTTSSGAKTHAVYSGAGSRMLFFLDAQKQYMALDFKGAAGTPNTSPSSAMITRAGTHKTVAGVDCEQISVKDASGHRSEVCVAQGIAYFDPSRLRTSPSNQAETALAKEFREKKSFPLESVELDADGTELSRMEVVKIEAAKVDDATFEVPAGYSEVTVPTPR